MYQVDLNFKADLNRAKRFLILFFFFFQCILEHVELSMSYSEPSLLFRVMLFSA